MDDETDGWNDVSRCPLLYVTSVNPVHNAPVEFPPVDPSSPVPPPSPHASVGSPFPHFIPARAPPSPPRPVLQGALPSPTLLQLMKAKWRQRKRSCVQKEKKTVKKKKKEGTKEKGARNR